MKESTDREKFQYLPEVKDDIFVIGGCDGPARPVEEAPPAPEPEPEKPAGIYPCPCCGSLSFPVPKEEALAYICPVCFWENDVFAPGEDDPSDENRGMTLRQGRENYRRWGAVRQDLAAHARRPRPGEMGPDTAAPWDVTFPQHIQPTVEEIAGWVDSPLFSELRDWMAETYGAEPSVEFSRCSMDRGWNVKYKKGTKALCACYIRRGYFTCMVTLGRKPLDELEGRLSTFTESFRKLYQDTPPFNGGKWLVMDVRSPEQLEDTERLILLKARPPKAKQ